MTTEEEFQARMDEELDNYALRMVFADFLEEKGDQRAEGYRYLGRERLKPYKHEDWSPGNHNYNRSGEVCWEWWTGEDFGRLRGMESAGPWIENHKKPRNLPREMWNKLTGRYNPYTGVDGSRCMDYETRREAEDAAAWAYHRWKVWPVKKRRKHDHRMPSIQNLAARIRLYRKNGWMSNELSLLYHKNAAGAKWWLSRFRSEFHKPARWFVVRIPDEIGDCRKAAAKAIDNLLAIMDASVSSGETADSRPN